MIKHHTPDTMRAPYANYSHGVELRPGARLLLAAGQVGVSPGDVVPEDVGEQAELCFENIRAVLQAAGMDLADIVRINTFLSDKAYLAPCAEVRRRYLPTPPPASTTLIVSGFAGNQFKIEIEVTAAKVDEPPAG